MKLSILLPTYRHDLLACSRIAQACSWAGEGIEVIVRDNSGNAQKRELLAHFRRDNCKIIIVDPCDPRENFTKIIRLAKGKFIFCLADDDFCFDRAITVLPSIIDQVGKDSSVAGITGAYAVEATQGSAIINYQGLESDDVVARVAGYLNEPGPNVLFYSVLRRKMVERIFAFIGQIPFYFSFHDQILCLLYLLNGKFVRLPRLLYLYDVGVWEETESAQKLDVNFYTNAGLDPAINKLHWFLCGFEGAVLARNSDIFPDYSLAQRQAISDSWFSTMFARFKGHTRLTFGSSFAGDVEKLCAKLQVMAGSQSLDGMLTDICGVLSLFSKSGAQSYFDFWDAVLNKRKPVARHADISKLSIARVS